MLVSRPYTSRYGRMSQFDAIDARSTRTPYTCHNQELNMKSSDTRTGFTFRACFKPQALSVAAAAGGAVKPRGMRAPAGGATRARNSFAMSIMRTHWTSSCVFTHSMKRSCSIDGHGVDVRMNVGATRRRAMMVACPCIARAGDGDRFGSWWDCGGHSEWR